MIKNEFTTRSVTDAMNFIQMHIEEGFIVSASQNRTKPKIVMHGYGFCPAECEYIIVATKEE